MKRILVISIALVAILLSLIYFGISSVQSFSGSRSVGCTQAGALRLLEQDGPVTKAWPGVKQNDSSYQLGALTYTKGRMLINSIALDFSQGELNAKGGLLVEEYNRDSSKFLLNGKAHLSSNPFKRINAYFAFQKLKNHMKSLLDSLHRNFEGEEMIYGLKIEMKRVTDSTMIAVKKTMDHYPTVAETYEIVDAIKNYIQQQDGVQSNNPMLNVYKEAEHSYFVMVAVPTTKSVAPNEFFLLKKMLPNGFILTGEITGGLETILQGEEMMKLYVLDHQKSSPAIPFQMLLTDRREADTAKWKTRLYYPVMY